MALRHYQPDHYEESHPKESRVTYQRYQVPSSASNRLKDVLFFLNITIFSILSVLATYIFLSLGLHTLLAFVAGMISGLFGLKATQLLIRHQYKRLKRKKMGVSASTKKSKS
ncbi:DUF3270 family protein [Streptococcus sp. DD13]|uniref:DUF3270 family protein n=1 Tax=Streptococcus sp. DD13 TaxID=1777881 RepID=UPI0007929FA4|nr:DUF3270 family protein [Streptococcus sp. DD13]KXT78453.1 hypothetical protein STRDD13_00756 [Streptococcus sp. DD13]